jgi:hypothetical protein
MYSRHSQRKRVTTMPVREMTDAEAERIFGGGLVIFGQKRPQPSSASSQASPQTQKDQPTAEESEAEREGRFSFFKV